MDGVHIAVAQQALQLGALEPRVALEVSRLALVDDHVDLSRVDTRVQRCTFGVLNAVHRPRPPAVGKRPVVGRVPVARRDDERRARGKPVDRLDDGVAVGHRQRSPGAEVVLYVDHEKSVHASRI